MAISHPGLLIIILLSAVGCKTQDVHETLQFRRNFRKLIEAKLDNLNSDLNSSLGDKYVKTLQELNIGNFQTNHYAVNTTVQLFAPLRCDVGIS